jgi:autotransporter translocation and assembly factor TamB
VASTLQHRAGVLKAGTSARRALRRLSGYIAIAVLTLLVVLGAGAAVTQTGWFKNWLRQKAVSQAAQYLNGELSIRTLSGNIFTGVALEGVALHHEGQTAVAMDRLTVHYSPLTMISQGVIVDSMTLENPTILLQRDEAGWNFNRFVKTRRNTGGRGAPPITLEAIEINNGHVIVKDRGRLVEDLTRLDTKFRFAYEKPGIAISIREMAASAPDMTVHSLAGNVRFDRGTIVARDVAIRTDRTKLVTSVSYLGPKERTLEIRLDAQRLSLPEIGRYFKPLASIRLEPAVDLTARGTLDALDMNVDVASEAGSARGPLVGHFGRGTKSLEGRLDVRNVDMAPILNRDEWKTRVTGQADFKWTFSPARIDFTFAGPHVEGLGYQATSARAKGVYEPSLLRFDASGAAYGASATTRATFRFATPSPLTYRLEGTFRNLDLRRLPARLSMPKLETQAAGRYTFESAGRNWSGSGELQESIVEGARFESGTLLAIESRDRRLIYSASGNVVSLNPRNFAAPLEVQWLDDDRFGGSLTGAFTFEGSGRTVDELVIDTKASLVDSTLAGARFPRADVDFQMQDRLIRANFAGPFEELPGTLFTDRKELADTLLNGSADMAVSLTVPNEGPTELLNVSGTATIQPSTVAGLAIESGQVTGSYAGEIADIKELVITGPEVKAIAAGTFAFGDTGESNLTFDVAATNVEPLGKRFNKPVSGSARVVGEATGPAANLTINGTFGGNRLRYGTNLDALTLNSKVTVQVPNFDIEQARVDADTAATFMTIAGTNLPRVTAKTVYQKQQLEFDVLAEEERRSLGLGGNVILHPDHDELHLRALDLTVGQTRWAMPAGQEATAQYRDNSVTLTNFTLQRGDQRLTAAGTVAVGAGSANLANDLDVRFENVQVQDINELMLGNRSLTGVLNATAQIRGTRSDPVVSSDFAITAGSVENVKFNSLGGTASYSERAGDVDVRLEQTANAVLTAVGTIPIPSGPGSRARAEEMDLAVKSSPIDLALFQPATTQLTKLTGQFSADVRVRGTIESPRLDGLVETTNGGFSVVATGVTYTNAIARLLLEGNRVLVDRFELTDDGRDQLVAIGSVGIERRSVGEMNLQISAADFKVLDNEYGNLEVNTDLRVTGEVAKPTVTGEILTEAGRMEIDRILDELTRSPYKTQATVAVEPVSETQPASDALAFITGGPMSDDPNAGLYDTSTIDVRLRLPDNLMLRGRDMHASFSRVGLGDMNITVGGDLQIRKAPGGEPDLVGTVTVVRGFYDFQGRRFEVLRDSQIRFQGTHPIDPALSVDAQRIISGITAIVNIRGTARQPQVRLSSQPPLDEADVLSLIIFNMPINQLGEGERLNLAERAGGLAVGYLATPLANSIAEALDLDIFEIRATGEETGQPSVALGQQFGSRLFVSFRQEFGSDDYRQLSLEYQLTSLLRLVSTVTQGNQRSHRLQRIDRTGVDLIYTISY